MMNLVITYANDHVAVFLIESDGSTTQTALINTGANIPTPNELAALGTRLAQEFAWQPKPATNGVVSAPALEVPAPKRGSNLYGGGHHPDEPSGAERKRMIIEVVKANPLKRARDIVALCGYEPTAERMTRWAHQLADLVKDGVLKRTDDTPPLYTFKRAPKSKQLGYNIHPDDPPVAERKRIILEALEAKPGLTRREIIATIGLDPTLERLTRWHHQFRELSAAGDIHTTDRKHWYSNVIRDEPVAEEVPEPVAEPVPTPSVPLFLNPFYREDTAP